MWPCSSGWSNGSGLGLVILYVSHKLLEEVFTLADRITVIRDGATVASSIPAAELDARAVVQSTAGQHVEMYHHVPHERGQAVLTVRGLSRAGAFADVDLTLHAGEVVGLAGLIGAGRSEVARCISADHHRCRRRAHGRPAAAVAQPGGRHPRRHRPRARRAQAPGDHSRPLGAENITLSLLDLVSSRGVLNRKAENAVVSRYITELGVKTPSAQTPIRSLSGGNQQKAILGRWLARKPKVLILDEPTKGIDVGAKAEIHRLIERLARSGVAVLLISSELPELLELSDRVAVMRAGRIVANLDKTQATKETVMSHAAA